MPWAHSRNEAGVRHDLGAHLHSVADLAASFAAPFGGEAVARAAGLLHDIGKAAPAFQEYLARCEREPGRRQATVGHKGAGAAVAARLGQIPLLIEGHHGGLPDAAEFRATLQGLLKDPAVAEGIAAAEAADLLPDASTPAPPGWVTTPETMDLFLRLAFSALVDADHLDTERHFSPGLAAERGGTPPLGLLADRLEETVDRLAAGGVGPVAEVRDEVYRACLAAATLPPGFFRLTVPTGGGKTLAGMAFALRHAIAHGMGRVIVAAPYLTITDQTADVYRRAFGTERAVLEHFGDAGAGGREPGTGGETAADLWRRLAAADWDAPVIVTTIVQLFESLLGNRTGKVRKVHRIAGSVIVLDEAQSLPPHLLEPMLAILSGLVAHAGASVVFCTATQPAFAAAPGFSSVEGIREIAPDPPRLFSLLRRVRYEWPAAPLAWEEVAGRMLEQEQALAIVNTRNDALALLSALPPGSALHLSTLLCPAHRRDVLARVRRRLRAGDPCRVVSTQVVEAGVDVDFPVVYRAMGPLDRIVQAAGRCNREGKLAEGTVVVFEPAGGGMPPGAYLTATGQTRAVLAGGADLDDPELFDRYFRLLFPLLDLDREGVQALRLRLAFASAAERARVIDDDQAGVIVPYRGLPAEAGAPATFHHAERSARAVEDLRAAGMEGLREARARLAAAQPYVVNLRQRALDEARAAGLVSELAGGLWAWEGAYDELTGMTVADPSAFVV